MIFSSLFHNCSLLGSDSLSYLFVAFTGRQTIQFLLFFKWQSALDNLSVYFLSLSFFFPLGWLFIQPIAKISPFPFSFFLFFYRHFPPFPYSATTSTTIVCNFNRCLLLFCHRHRHRVNHQQVLLLLQEPVFSGPFSGNSQASAASFPPFLLLLQLMETARLKAELKGQNS